MKRLILCLLLFLFQQGLHAQQAIRPSLVEWHSRYDIKKVVFTFDGHYLLSLGDDNAVIISDLKKRLPVNKVEQVSALLLAAHPSRPLFYTAVKENDSLSIQQRSVPSGAIRSVARIPLRMNDSWQFRSPELIEVFPEEDRILLPYDSSGFTIVAGYTFEGRLSTKLPITSADPVNAIQLQGGITWVTTANGLFRESAGRLTRMVSPLNSSEVFGNMQVRQNTVVLLSDQHVTWYDISSQSILRKPVNGFFATSAQDSKASLFRFHHPFAVGRDLEVWVANTQFMDLEKTIARRPYSLARVTPAAIDYPFFSPGEDSRKMVSVEPEVAYHPASGALAMLTNAREVLICDREQGALFALNRKNLPVRSFYFTGQPGKILVQTDGMQSPGFMLNLSNGRMETIGVMDELFYQKRARSPETVATGVIEQLWWPSQQRYLPAQYWSYRETPYLSYPFRDGFFPRLPGNQVLEMGEGGVLMLKDTTGRLLKKTELFGLVNEAWGMGMENNRLVPGNLKKVAYNNYHFASGYQYDSASALFVLFLQESATSNPRTVHVIDLKKFEIIRSYASDDLFILTGSRQVVTDQGIFDLNDHQLVTPFPQEVRGAKDFTLSRDRQHLYFYRNGYEEGDRFYRWDLAAKKARYLGRQQGISQIACDPHSGLVFTRGLENSLMIWQGDSGQLATIVFSGEKDFRELRQVDGSFLVLQPDGYYMGDNKYYNLLKLQDGIRSYSISDIDVLFHRPDKVLATLGYAAASATEPLRQQAERRVARNKVQLVASDLAITNPGQLPFYAEGKVTLHTNLPASLDDYKGLMLYVNGTALYPSPLPLPASNRFTATAELVDAFNHLRVCLVKKDGRETPGDYVYVNSATGEGAEIYLVGIGVSEYKDSAHNLKYAAKDMNDLMNYLSTTDTYAKVHLTRFSNRQVTRNVVDSIQRLLQKAKSRDVVMCYYAGHGVLDKQNDYYLGSYDINFDDPATAGIDIRKLNEAVSASAARKKMIFVDACHSGLVDDLATATDSLAGGAQDEQGVVRRGLVIRKQQKASSLQYSFSHFNQGTGVDIIAASAGNEYALELGSIRNGVFTYSLLKAFKSGEADFNHDSRLTLNELQQYVSGMTRRLTRGAQRPTFRQNNLYQDIVLLSTSDSYLGRFMDAAKSDHVETLKLLLENNEVEVDQKNKDGFTALAYASRQGAFKAAKYLVEKGASVHLKTDFGASPLYLAAWNDHHRLAYYLMTKDASVAVDLLEWQQEELRNKNTPAITDLMNRYPAIKTEQEKYLRIAMALLENRNALADSLFQAFGLPVNGMLIIEGLPLVVAPILGKNTEGLKWVIEKGGDVNLPSLDDRFTPLMFAANLGSTELVQLLLDRGADRRAKDSKGRTAADFARQAGFESLSGLLK